MLNKVDFISLILINTEKVFNFLPKILYFIIICEI